MRVLFLALLMAFMSFPVVAKTTLKIATVYPPGSEAIKTLQALSESLKEQTNGEVSLKLYPGGVMGDDGTVLRKLRIGQLQGALVSAATLDIISTDLKDLSQPFQFDTLDQVYQLRINKDPEIRARLSEAGWSSFGPLDGGFSFLMSKRPIVSMAELKKSKLWLPNTSDIQRMSNQLGVSYLVMNIGDVLTGLDTGAINSLVAPPAAALTMNWHSRFEYFADTPVMYTWGMLVFPEKIINRIPDDQRKTVQRLLSEWAVTLDESLRSSNENATTAIEQLLNKQEFSSADVELLRQGVQSAQ